MPQRMPQQHVYASTRDNITLRVHACAYGAHVHYQPIWSAFGVHFVGAHLPMHVFVRRPPARTCLRTCLSARCTRCLRLPTYTYLTLRRKCCLSFSLLDISSPSSFLYLKFSNYGGRCFFFFFFNQ